MSAITRPPRRPSAGQLLSRILETPELVAAVGALEPRALTRLIHHVGLEDAGEIVMLAAPEQLARVFDEDLWSAESAGLEERFDAERFALWLEVISESASEDALAGKLAELPRELVLLGLQRSVLVIDLEDLLQTMRRAGDDDSSQLDQLEKALESTLYQEIDTFQVIARRHDGWDAVIGALLALDKNHHDVLVELLERCAAMSAEHIADNGGLYNVLSADEMLESDVGGEREDRRAREGYIAPAAATAFLALAAQIDVAELQRGCERDAVTRTYFRDLRRGDEIDRGGGDSHTATDDRATDDSATDDPTAGQQGVGRDETRAAPDPSRLLAALRESGVLDRQGAPPLLQAATIQPGERPRGAALARAALAELRLHHPSAYDARFSELAYLANVLVAGHQRGTDRLRPCEAAELALRVVGRGIEHRLGPGLLDPLDRAQRLLRREHADILFRLGWRLRLDENESLA